MTRAEKIQSNNLSVRYGGILDCIDNKNLSNEEISILMQLKSDKRMIAGRSISSYAKAALEILGIEKCTSDIDASRLVEALS